MLPLLQMHAEPVASGQLGYWCCNWGCLLWHMEMACGVHLGILLIVLVQAEHVRCLWATQAQSSQTPQNNRYVGYSQHDSGLRGLGGSYPQNQLRQMSAQSRSFKTHSTASSGTKQGLSRSGYTQTHSQPAQIHPATARLFPSSSLSTPNRGNKRNQVNAQKVPIEQIPLLSTAIASGSSLSHNSRNQKAVGTKRRNLPVPEGTLHTSSVLSSSSVSVLSPSRTKSTSYHSAAQKNMGPRGFSPMESSSSFGSGAPAPQRKSVQMQTSATARARKVPLRRGSKVSNPPRFSPSENETERKPSQTWAPNGYQSKQFSIRGNVQGRHEPPPTYSMASSLVSSSKTLPLSNKGVNPQPRSFAMPKSQRLSYKPSHASTEQFPSRMSSLHASENGRPQAQGAHNLPATGGSSAGTSAQRFAPTKTHSIPQRFGGYAIRRLKEPADEEEVSIRKPQQTLPAPSWQSLPAPSQQTQTIPSRESVSYKPQVQSAHPNSKWKRVRPGGMHAGAHLLG